MTANADSLPAVTLVAEDTGDAQGKAVDAGARKRPKPGERRVQILEALASMLEQPGAERVTTAALAARLDVSEAALYRHFASKAQMFEGLIDFIEQSVFSLVNQLGEREPDAVARCRKLVTLLLQFGERNPGMARVMVGDALVFENERLQQRMNLFFDKIESSLRQDLARRGRAGGLGHTHGRCAGQRLGGVGVLRRTPSALRAQRLQAPAQREPGTQPGRVAAS